MIRTYLDWILTLPWDKTTEDNLDLEQARRILDEDHFDLEKVKDRIVEYLAVSKLKGDVVRADPLLRRPARRRQDLARPVDRAHARPQVRPHLGRRRPRRGGDPRPPAHVHRRDARHDHPRDPRRRVEEPGLPDRRDRQDGRRLARRPGQRDARGARPRAELDLPRPLPRPAVRPLEGALHLHREPARDDPRPAARPHGRDPALRATPRRRRSRSPSATSCRSSSRRTGSTASRSKSRTRRCGRSIREYTREAGVRNLERRIADVLPQGGAAGRRGRDRSARRRRGAACASALGPRRFAGEVAQADRPTRASRPASR